MERNAVCCVSHADLSLLPTVANCKSPDLSGLAWVFGPWYRGHKCVLARGCECACDEVILRVALRGIDFHRAEVAGQLAPTLLRQSNNAVMLCG